jgi:hypothetical protein
VAAEAAIILSDATTLTSGTTANSTTTVNRVKWDTTSVTSAAATNISGGDLQTADMYMNNIYVLPKIHGIFIARVGFTLIRVHRNNHSNTFAHNSEKQMSSLKWPIEAIYFGFRPNANENTMNNWWQYSNVTSKQSRVQGRTYVTDLSGATGSDTVQLLVGTAVVDDYTYDLREHIASTISLKLHGQPLYNSFPAEFFSDYVPTIFGGCDISSSEEDVASCMITFGLFPGMYQPHGHLNVSRAREIFIGAFYATAFQSTTTDLVSEADALNFLLISDGNAVLRYST